MKRGERTQAGRPVPGEQRPPLDGGDVRDGPGVSSVQPGLQGGGHQGPAGGRRQVLRRERDWGLGREGGVETGEKGGTKDWGTRA